MRSAQSASQPGDGALEGRIAGRYRIERMLGVGGAAPRRVLGRKLSLVRADVLEPLSALSKDGATGVMYEFCSALASSALDTTGESHARLGRVLARLESPLPIRGLPEPMRKRYFGGVLYVLGLQQGTRDDDRRDLDAVDAARHLAAHARCHRHEARIAGGLRLSRSVPVLEPVAQRSRGMYLMLHGKYLEALPALEGCLQEPIRGRTGWGRLHGTLAHTYNALGEYARAKATCGRVIAEMAEADHAFAALSIPVLT